MNLPVETHVMSGRWMDTPKVSRSVCTARGYEEPHSALAYARNFLKSDDVLE